MGRPASHSNFERYSRADEPGFPEHVSVAERRRNAQRESAALRSAGRKLAPVQLPGRVIAATELGRAWCEAVASLPAAGGRLAGGRSYVRSGAVIDLRVEPGAIHALVCGATLYTVEVHLRAPVQPELFPSPGEVTARCTCPDDTPLCKHALAALYAVGARLDEEPGLIAVLRADSHRAR